VGCDIHLFAETPNENGEWELAGKEDYRKKGNPFRFGCYTGSSEAENPYTTVPTTVTGAGQIRPGFGGCDSSQLCAETAAFDLSQPRASAQRPN